MRNVKVYFNDRGFKPVSGETVAGFYVHRAASIKKNGDVSLSSTRWTITEPNTGKSLGVVKTRDAARIVARKIRTIFQQCGIARGDCENIIQTKIRGRASDVVGIIKSFA